LVLIRRRRGRSAFFSNTVNFSMASARFIAWVRWTRDSTTRLPMASSRDDSCEKIRLFTCSGNEQDATGNRSRTAVATLFTFCPPGPLLPANNSAAIS